MTNTLFKRSTEYKWGLKNKITGDVYLTFTYPTRDAARQAAKGHRFSGQYTPVKIWNAPNRTTANLEVSLQSLLDSINQKTNEIKAWGSLALGGFQIAKGRQVAQRRFLGKGL